MAVIVLVHGAWHGGWCWQKVTPLLQAAGHRVYAPTLTGLGERAHLARPGIDLELHVRDVLAVLEYEDLREVVLVGHSYGCVVGSVVADRAPERLARLIYLDGPIPEDGQALFDLQTPAQVAAARASTAAGDGWRIPPNSAAALGIVEAADAAWVEPRLTPQALATFEQPVRLTGAGAAVPRAYIFCAPARPGSLLIQFARRAQAAGWTYREVVTGHDAMISAPGETAALLLELAAPRT